MTAALPTLLDTLHTAPTPDDGVAALARELGVSPRAARACWLRLRAVALALEAANDDARPWIATVRLGARLLTVEGDAAVADAATRLLARLDGTVPARAVSDVSLRAMVTAAITERRVLSLAYDAPEGSAPTRREVEPLALSHVDGHWTVLAFCRTRGDLRSFRFDRVRDARLTEASFEPRHGVSLERFILRQKSRARLAV